MSNAIVGIYDRPTDAARTIDDLAASGVAQGRISVVATEPTARQSLGIKAETKGAEGAALGGGIGAAAGALLAGLTTVGAIATGGAGVLVAGPLVAALTGAGAGAVTGGVIGGLVGLGFSEHEIKHFKEALEEGSVLVEVDTDDYDDEDAVEDVMKNHNAADVSMA
jgi:hypothetical protein